MQNEQQPVKDKKISQKRFWIAVLVTSVIGYLLVFLYDEFDVQELKPIYTWIFLFAIFITSYFVNKGNKTQKFMISLLSIFIILASYYFIAQERHWSKHCRNLDVRNGTCSSSFICKKSKSILIQTLAWPNECEEDPDLCKPAEYSYCTPLYKWK